jgi:FlaG/FlaF family flagellin (archaellin)
MRYESGDKLFYACPFIFTIELVCVEFAVEEYGIVYYIETDGAYLAEHDLFENLKDAKEDAFDKLNKFYQDKTNEIYNTKITIEDLL